MDKLLTNQIQEHIDNISDDTKYNILSQLENDQQHLDLFNQNPDEFELSEDDGYIEVRNGEVFIRNPKESGREPILYPHQKIRVFVNDKEIKSGTVVKERDKVSLRPLTPEPFTISISEDKQKVFLQLDPSMIISYRLKNKKRSLKFRFDLEQIEKEIDVEKYSSFIIDEIMKKGIKCEFNMSAILDELKSPTFKPILVAEGIPVIESIDAFVETNFPSNLEISFEEVNGRIDFRNRLKIPNAEPGDVIAKIYKELEGKDGVNVYGETLHPKKPKKIEVRTKSKTQLKEDGRVIALKAGRPTITGSAVKYFDILPVHNVIGDVDFKSGNIHFSGDVVVYGNVQEGMRVDALGNVYIKGNVYSATVVSTQNVYIEGMAINSKIFAGQHGVLINQLYKLIQNMNFTFERLVSAVRQVCIKLEKGDKELPIGKIIRLLVEQKYHKLDEYVNEFFNILLEAQKNDIAIPVHLIVLKRTLYNFKSHVLMLQIKSIDVINNIQFALREAIFQSESAILDSSEIVIAKADMSIIKANGKITISGPGTINTEIFSGTEIAFLKKDSVIRGGKVEAVDKVTAGIVGSEKGSSPHLIAGNQIEAVKINHANIKIRNATKIIYDAIEHIVYTYEEETETIISYSKGSGVASLTKAKEDE